MRLLPRLFAFALAALAVLNCAQAAEPVNLAELQRQVGDTERAFAASMARRDFAAFSSFLSAEALFITSKEPLRGKEQVAAAWKRFFDKPEAPFSWSPAKVEVLDSGLLAISTGPVLNGDGKKIATFNSIWRQESPGVWRIIFDKGDDACDCAKP